MGSLTGALATVCPMRRALYPILVSTLILAACSGGDDGSDTTTTSEAEQSSTTAAPATTTTAPVSTTTSQEASAGQGGGGPDCLVGTWILDTDNFVDQMVSLLSAEEELEVDDISGTDGTYEVTMSFDGTWSGVREDWGFVIASSEGSFTIEMNGTDSGVWSATSDSLTVTVEESDTTVSATVEVEGQTFPLPESPVDLPESIATDSDYTCDGDTLTVMNDGSTTILNRS